MDNHFNLKLYHLKSGGKILFTWLLEEETKNNVTRKILVLTNVSL